MPNVTDPNEDTVVQSVTEVRVHGVSGTPPSAILRTDPRVWLARPVPDDEPHPPRRPEQLDRKSRRRRPVDVAVHPVTDYELAADRSIERDTAGLPLLEPQRITAYNWSKLTSGLARHALWLLLLPYTLMNVAGWMLPQRARSAGQAAEDEELSYSGGRALDMLIRVAGGVVTAIFSMFMAAKCRPGTDTCSFVEHFPWSWSPGIWLFAGSALALLTTVAVGFAIGYDPPRARQADDAGKRLIESGGLIRPPRAVEPDPVAALGLTHTSLWHRRSLTLHLIWVHTGTAAVVLTWVLVAIRMNTTIEGDSVVPYTFWIAILATVVVGAALAAASVFTHGDAGSYTRVALGSMIVGILGFLLAALDAAALSDLSWAAINVETGLAVVALVVTGILTVIGSVVWLVGWFSRRANTAGSAAMVVLAGLFGGSFGAGSYTLLQRMFISGREAREVTRDGVTEVIGEAVAPLGGLDWAAAGFLIFLLAAIIVALVIVVRSPLLVSPRLVTEGLRAVTQRVTQLLGIAALVALVGGTFFLVVQLASLDDLVDSPFETAESALEVTIYGLIAIALLLVIAVVFKFKGPLWASGATVALGLVYWGIATDRLTEFKLLGFVVRLDSVRELTVSLALLVPAGFMVSRVITMVRDREQRRGVGILWDLGSFWQRWYHPFAAPTYGPVAIADLAAYVREQARTPANRCAEAPGVVVAAHSQGTVIAMAALLTIDADDVYETLEGLDAAEREAVERANQRRRAAEEELLGRVAFLSYGSPISHLYEKLFPGYFNAGVINDLKEKLNGDGYRWQNLWRQSDPIGGRVTGLGDDQEIDEAIADGHSSYEKTFAFRKARSGLIRTLAGDAESEQRSAASSFAREPDGQTRRWLTVRRSRRRRP